MTLGGAPPDASQSHDSTGTAGASGCRSYPVLLLPSSLHRRWNPHRLAIFRDRAPCDVDAGLAQLFHDGIVRQYILWAFGVDHVLNAVAHGFRRMGLAVVGGDRKSTRLNSSH